MNDKIKELARHTEVDAGYIPRYDMWQMDTESLEKFAELIVRECAAVAGKFVQDNEYKEDGISEYRLRDKIKEHFGVDP